MISGAGSEVSFLLGNGENGHNVSYQGDHV